MSTKPGRPLSILVCALGGEGGGVLAEWIVTTASRCGYAAQSTSIPGVAQRTGATTYYIEIARRPTESAMFSLYAVPGALDILIASEPLEAARQVAAGFVTAERTRVITSSERTLTTFEKMQLADGRADTAQLLELLRDYSRRLDVLAMSTMARAADTALSAAMFGALSGSGELPLAREACDATIRGSGRSAKASLEGFARAHAAVGGNVAPADDEQRAGVPLPLPVQAMAALGRSRLVDYQDVRYADLHAERLSRVLAAERIADPTAAQDFATTRETARYLASWMAFDDVVRVADLKSRSSRIARVRDEVKASPDDILRIYDHFKPGIPELAGLLPARLAERLARWDRRRIARGREPFGWPIKLPTHSVAGLVMLRAIGALKRVRRHGSRFAAEQAMIERWLAAIERGLREDWRLGHEIALCGRLVKGYGATNERGKANLLHVIEHLVAVPSLSAGARATAIREAREAALADDAGKAFDAALQSHGAPPQPVKVQPVRFVRAPASRKVA